MNPAMNLARVFVVSTLAYLSDSSGGWGVGSGQGTGGSIHLSGIGSENGTSLGSGAGGSGAGGVGGSGVGEGLPGFCWFLILSIP